MALNLGRFIRDRKRDIEDVFSANTERDQQKRIAAGQPRFYADQQRQQRPAPTQYGRPQQFQPPTVGPPQQRRPSPLGNITQPDITAPTEQLRQQAQINPTQPKSDVFNKTVDTLENVGRGISNLTPQNQVINRFKAVNQVARDPNMAPEERSARLKELSRPRAIVEDLVPGGGVGADLIREVGPRGGARILESLAQNKVTKNVPIFPGVSPNASQLAGAVRNAQKTGVGKFILGDKPVETSEKDLQNMVGNTPVLKDLAKFGPVAFGAGVAMNVPGVGGLDDAGKAAKAISQANNVEDVAKVVAATPDLEKVISNVDDAKKAQVLEDLAKEKNPENVKKIVQEANSGKPKVTLKQPDPLESLKQEARTVDYESINKAQDEAKSFMTQMIDKYQPQKNGQSMKITDMMSKSEKAQMDKLNKAADDLYTQSQPPKPTPTTLQEATTNTGKPKVAFKQPENSGGGQDALRAEAQKYNSADEFVASNKRAMDGGYGVGAGPRIFQAVPDGTKFTRGGVTITKQGDKLFASGENADQILKNNFIDKNPDGSIRMGTTYNEWDFIKDANINPDKALTDLYNAQAPKLEKLTPEARANQGVPETPEAFKVDAGTPNPTAGADSPIVMSGGGRSNVPDAVKPAVETPESKPSVRFKTDKQKVVQPDQEIAAIYKRANSSRDGRLTLSEENRIAELQGQPKTTPPISKTNGADGVTPIKRDNPYSTSEQYELRDPTGNEPPQRITIKTSKSTGKKTIETEMLDENGKWQFLDRQDYDGYKKRLADDGIVETDAEMTRRIANYGDKEGALSHAQSTKPAEGKLSVTLKRTTIDPNDPFGNTSKAKRVKNELGRIVDDDSQMIAMLKKVEKETGQTGLVDQWYFDSGNIRASASIANAKIKNSPELRGALSGLSKRELDDFDAYVAARAELNNYEGLTVSRDPEQLQAIVQAGDRAFGERFASLNQYYKKMAQDMYDGGLISKQKLDEYLVSDDYVRIQRDMEELVGNAGGSSRARSIGSTTATQKRKGSKRDVLSPTKTALSRTQQIQLEIQRNTAASNTIDVLEELGLAKPVPNSVSKNTVSRLVDGERQIYEVPGEIKEVMDNVNPYQLGIIAKIVSAPSRLFRAGTTALSAPFTVTNYLRDQASSAIYSKDVLATHAPQNIIAGIGSATKDFAGESHSPLWAKFEEFAGDQTVFDELRNAKSTKKMLREVSQGGKGKAKNMVISPVRTLEDANSITEKATRFQNFKGIYEKTLAKTGDQEEAIKQAVLAARQNSVDFGRSSAFTRAMNLIFPYFNASVQGSRNVARSFKERPLATSIKSVGFVAAPTVGLTMLNMSGLINENSREIYDSIDDYEKENNFILIGPNAKQRDDGTWEGIVKVPKPQGYRELTDPAREVTEYFISGQPTDSILEMTKDMLGAFTGPINIQDAGKFRSSLTPQMLRSPDELGANKNYYTGSQVVPDYMIEGTEDPTKRAFENTSGSSQWIADQLGVSPIQVDKVIKDNFGSLGLYGTNALDNAVAKVKGDNPLTGKNESDFNIGGRSMKSDFSRRLFEVNADLLDKNKTSGQQHYGDTKEVLESGDFDSNTIKRWEAIHTSRKNFLGDQVDEKTIVDAGVKAGVYIEDPDTFEIDRRVDQKKRDRGLPGNPIFDLSPQQRQVVLSLQANKSFNPGDKAMPDVIEKQQPWLKGFQDKYSNYFDEIKVLQEKEKTEAKASGKKVSEFEDVDPSGIPKPEISDVVSNKLEAASKITDKTAKAKFYDQNKDVSDYLAQNEEYNRAKRAFLGLPQLDRFPGDPKLDKVEDGYFALTDKGARKAYMKAHPELSDYWLEKNLWQLNEAGARARYEGEELDADALKDIKSIARSLGGGGGYGSGGGGKDKTAGDPYKYALDLNAGGKVVKPNVRVADIPKPKVAKKGTSKPKVTLKKSKV